MKTVYRSILGVSVFIVAVNFTLLKCGVAAWVLHPVSAVFGFWFTTLALRDARLAEETP